MISPDINCTPPPPHTPECKYIELKQEDYYIMLYYYVLFKSAPPPPTSFVVYTPYIPYTRIFRYMIFNEQPMKGYV